MRKLQEGTSAIIAYQLQNGNYRYTIKFNDSHDLLKIFKAGIKRGSYLANPDKLLSYGDSDIQEVSKKELDSKFRYQDYNYIYFPFLNSMDVYRKDNLISTLEEKIIEIQEEIQIGEVILEKGDKIKIIQERSNYFNPDVYEKIQDDIAFWVENKGAFEAGKVFGQTLHEMLQGMRMGGEINSGDLTKFVNGIKQEL